MRARACTIAAVLGMVLYVTPAGARDRVYYFHNDHVGTPQAMTDATGRKVWEAEYEPFGKATVNEDPDGDGQIVVNNLRFPGQYYDAETGLHYNYHRDYDPSTGRYLQPDPIPPRPDEMNPYVYVSNNPLRFTDPTGLDKLGCDSISDGNPCRLECCAKHDECFDKNNCGAESFLPFLGSKECKECNDEVKACIYYCTMDDNNKCDNPNIPNYYCKKQHRYVKIPGDFPDYKSAKMACNE